MNDKKIAKDEKLAKEQFNRMDRKGKISYIWEYYKIHIILTILAILGSASIINAVFINPSPKLFVGVGFYGIRVSDDFMGSIKNELTEKLVPEDDNREVRFSAFYKSESDATVEVDLGQKFEMLMLSKELDILVAKEEDFKNLVNEGYIVNLDEYMDNEFIKQYEENGMVFKGTNIQDSTERIYGINIKASSLFSKSDELMQDLTYIGFVRNNEHAEDAVKTIKEILK